jgi:hypothetical protein
MQGGVQKESLMESAIKEVYEVSLDPEGEVIKYCDGGEVYYFSLRRKNGKWIIYLPATKLAPFRRHELTEEEQKVIFPRIRRYLEPIKYFILFGRSPVIFEREEPISP